MIHVTFACIETRDPFLIIQKLLPVRVKSETSVRVELIRMRLRPNRAKQGHRSLTKLLALPTKQDFLIETGECAQHPYTHTRPCVQLKQSRKKIISWKHFYHLIGMTDKLFASYWCLCVTVSFILFLFHKQKTRNLIQYWGEKRNMYPSFPTHSISFVFFSEMVFSRP